MDSLEFTVEVKSYFEAVWVEDGGLAVLIFELCLDQFDFLV